MDDARLDDDARPAELARYLPLSIKPRYDESRVTNNWAPRLGDLLATVGELLDPLPPDPLPPQARSIALAVAGRADRGALATAPDSLVVDSIHAAAAERRTGAPTARIALVGAVLVDALELARAYGKPLPVDGTLSGAVALARSLRAPLPIRAAIRDRTLVATDAGWRIGSGRDLPGTAAEHVLFLYGRSGMPGSN